MSKNVAVFVDVANIFYAAKAAGVDIDYVTLLKAAVAGRDFVRAYAYTGLDPENENQRNFHSFLARHGYKVVSKDIRKYGDGKVKANLDIELVVDMMKTARNLDVAIVVSGDGDFAPAIRAVQEMGVRVEVVSFRGNTSSDLIEVADVFTDITQIARVDRDSQRSGRRVAGDEEDLSMTEVPDKQTEGAPRRRRGGGRGRPERPERPERVAASTNGRQARGGGVAAAPAQAGGRIVALPGEKLSRVDAGQAEPEVLEEVAESGEIEVFTERDAGLPAAAEGTAEDLEGQAEGRRRRRRGGRGRGRGGRGQEEGQTGTQFPEDEEPAEEQLPPAALAAPAPRPNPFGSVWDSQIGMATPQGPNTLTPLPADDEDYAEPEIPEYLLAERRRGRGGRGGGGGGGRGGARSAYVSAMERERFGRSRYPEPARPAPQQPRRRDERPARQQPQRQQPSAQQRGGPRSSSEPWSEVPPELEEMLRAQLAARMSRPAGEAQPTEGAQSEAEETQASTAEGAVANAGREAARAPRSRGRRSAAATQATVAETTPQVEPEAAAQAAAEPVATRGRGRRRTAETATTAAAQGAAATEGVQAPAEEAAAPARRRRTTRAAAEAPAAEGPVAEAAPSSSAAGAAADVAAAPRPATRRRAAARAETPEAAEGETPKRRAPARRRTAASQNDQEGGQGGAGEQG